MIKIFATLLISIQFLFVSGCSYTDFSLFKYKYNKSYTNINENHTRYLTYCNNMNYINDYNNHSTGLLLGENQFADMTNKEYNQQRSLRIVNNTDTYKRLNYTSVPDNMDWRKYGKVTPIKDQGQCGSCWAFSAIESLESANAIHGESRELYNLSEQQLVDCSGEYGNDGCGGGLMVNAFKYIVNNGICLNKTYPYVATDGTCKKCPSVLSIRGYFNVVPNDEAQLKMAVINNPVSVAIDASDPTFQFYKSGIYNISNCGNELDHAVLAIGFGRDDVYKLDYWIVRNSWGLSWGDSGYIYMRRNTNDNEGMCGIAMEPSFPIV